MVITALFLLVAFMAIVLVKHCLLWQPMDVSYLYQNGYLKFGHRGSSMLAPENTLTSFLKAVEQGVNTIEVDVLLTKDGKVVCSHNHDLESETDGYGYIDEKMYEELKEVDASVKFPEYSPCRIPLLEEVFDIVPEDIIVDIEIKSKWAFDLRTAKYVAEIIRERNLYHRVLVSSFHPFVIGRIKWIDKRIPTAYLWEDQHVPNILKKPRFINLVHPDMLHPDVYFVDKNLIRFAQRKGLRINPWTVNNQPAIEWLLKLGADGIFSDFPGLMNRAVEKIGGSNEPA